MIPGAGQRGLTAVALAAFLAGAGCNALPFFEDEPGELPCGAFDEETGSIRICPETHPWCVCETHRCAVIDLENCTTGFEYRDGRCIEYHELSSIKPSLPFNHPACTTICSSDVHCDDGLSCNGRETCADSACIAGEDEADGAECMLDGESAGVCRGGRCAAPTCGDEVVDPPFEQCDDGNLEDDWDSCRNNCTWTCITDGDCNDDNPCNGIEACSPDGDHSCTPGDPLPNGTECSMLGLVGRCLEQTCIWVTCGNGILDEGEQCDEGEGMTNNGECLINCRLAACGDGHVWAGQEECDDGDLVEGDGCDTDCTWSCLTDEQCRLSGVCRACDRVTHACEGANLDGGPCELDGDPGTSETCEEGACTSM
jgi:cysteine-rich repeat protein